MSRWLIVLLLAFACGEKDQHGSDVGKHRDAEREQARFDIDRKPERIVEALGLKPGSIVADVGAGSGLLTIHLARAVRPGGKVVATDIDEGVLGLLRDRLQAAGLDALVERRVVTAHEPGLEAGTYDAILVAEVDHYFEDPVAWLRAAAKSLKPGGRLVLSNRVDHRDQSVGAATRAGLKLVSESKPEPTHFVVVFTT